MGFLAVVAVLAVGVAVGVVVVVGVCSPLVYGQRFFVGVVVVGVCSPLVLVWLICWLVWWMVVCSPLVFVWFVGGVFSALVRGLHLFVGVVDDWCLLAFGFGVVGWWPAFFSPLV